ncbi:MAG TPA: hypothetical protein VJQ42_04545 [Rhodanobacteraceae bacterium]|nr:hypothetical protein [Rhodanobacteraceae bacterium]
MDKMNEWPAWQRWSVWLLGWVLYLSAFWLLFAQEGVVMRVIALAEMCAGLLVLTYASRAVLNERMRKIDRRQIHLVLPAMLVYMLLMLYVFPREAQIAVPWLKALVALSPMLPLLVVAWAVVRYVNGCDELERRQHLESAGIAVIVVSVISMSLGFLGVAKLVTIDASLVLLMVFPALCVVYGLACTWSKWRNRAQ